MACRVPFRSFSFSTFQHADLRFHVYSCTVLSFRNDVGNGYDMERNMERNNLKHNNLQKFKKLPTAAAAKKRHFKIELLIKLSVSRLFHVHHVVQNRRSPLSLARHEWFSRNERFTYCSGLVLGESVDMSTDISVEHRSTYRPICRSRCRPTYRSRGS